MSTRTESVRPTAPGRPRQFDETEVLDAAVEIFWRHGFRGTSTRDLEMALAMRQSSIYNAFGSKQGLIEAALDRYISRASEALLVPFESSRLGLDSIDDFVLAVCEWIGDGGYRGCLVVNHFLLPDSEPGVTQRTGAYLERVNCALAAALTRAVRRDEITAESVPFRLGLLSGVVLGLTVAGRGGRAARSDLDSKLAGVRSQLVEWRELSGRYHPAPGR